MPSTDTWPVVGAIRSATMRSKVDLPQPDGPSRLRNPPRSTENEMFSSAVTVRRSVTKRIDTLRQETAQVTAVVPAATGGAAIAGLAVSLAVFWAVFWASMSAGLRPGVGGHLRDVQHQDFLDLRRAPGRRPELRPAHHRLPGCSWKAQIFALCDAKIRA